MNYVKKMLVTALIVFIAMVMGYSFYKAYFGTLDPVTVGLFVTRYMQEHCGNEWMILHIRNTPDSPYLLTDGEWTVFARCNNIATTTP